MATSVRGAGLLSLVLLASGAGGCADRVPPAAPPATVTPRATVPPTAAFPPQIPSTSLGVNRESPSKAAPLVVGSLAEISSDRTCEGTGGTVAYAETRHFRIYICGDRDDPLRARYYRSRNRDGSGGLDLEARDYDPCQGRVCAFQHAGYRYALQIPLAQIARPVLTVTFPNGKRLEEPIQRYLSRQPPTVPPVASRSSADILTAIALQASRLNLCDGEEVSTKLPGSMAYSLGDRGYFVQFQCFLGPYQGAYEFYLARDREPGLQIVPLLLDTYEENAGQAARRQTRQVAGYPTFTPATDTLRIATKYRGLGDCGALATYTLTGDRLVLQTYRAKFDCDGRATDPDQYPQIYPRSQQATTPTGLSARPPKSSAIGVWGFAQFRPVSSIGERRSQPLLRHTQLHNCISPKH